MRERDPQTPCLVRGGRGERLPQIRPAAEIEHAAQRRVDVPAFADLREEDALRRNDPPPAASARCPTT